MRAASRRTGRAPTTVEVRVSARTHSPLPRTQAERLARAVLGAEGVRHAVLSIAFVGRDRIRSLNRRHRGQDRETDVLAFSLQAGTGARGPRDTVVGDVYVCAPVGVGQAAGFGASPVEEVRRLLVHGVLHVLGYDHPEGSRRTASAMWRRQEQLLARFGRPR
jgi:probable rRNA maturation factor